MQVLKTPESAFDKIPDFPYVHRYVAVTDTISSEITMAYYQCGPAGGHTILLMHGEPTWAYLYRKMMPILAKAGFNVVVPDLIGFGRSDKPMRKEDYTYARHVIWLKEWFTQVVKGPTTLFCQDWGGLLGLRLVADMPERFTGVMVSNTGLPTGDHPASDGRLFPAWDRHSSARRVGGPLRATQCRTSSLRHFFRRPREAARRLRSAPPAESLYR